MSDLRTFGQGTYGSGTYGMADLVPADSAHFVIEVFSGGQWVDVTCDVRALATRRGRSKQLDAFTAGTAVLTLQDFEDKYNAWNPSSVWGSGAFRTDVPMRLRAFTTAREDWLWTGTTDAIEDSWPDTTDALTKVEGTDAFKSLARQRLPTVAAAGAGELGGARINRLLTAAQFTDARDVNAGSQHFAATTMNDVALTLLDQVREGESGAFFIAADGTATFRDQASQDTDPRMVDVQWTFSDRDADTTAATATCYSELTLTTNDDEVINSASVTRPGGSTQLASQADSVAWYGPRTYTATDIPLANDVDALTLAQLVVHDGAYNERRIDAIVFYPLLQKHGANVATGVRLLDRIRLLRHTPAGNTIDVELLVQGIRHDVAGAGIGRRPGTWRCELATTNARVVRDAGLWDAGRWDEAKWGA